MTLKLISANNKDRLENQIMAKGKTFDNVAQFISGLEVDK